MAKNKMGKDCGYVEHEDGSISLATMYHDQLTAIAIEQEATNELMSQVTKNCWTIFQQLVKQRHQLWERIAADYSLDYENFDYDYNRETKRLHRKPRESKSEKVQSPA